MDFLRLFSVRQPVIGMVHLHALPGTPASVESFEFVLEQALADTEVLCRSGVDGILIENMHDVPYLKGSVGPEITACMAVAARAIREKSQCPCGVQVLAGANKEALAVALSAGLEFIRVEGFVFGHVADEGWLDATAGELLRYRRAIGAQSVYVLADIKKKHAAHAVTEDVDIAETASAANFFRADGLIVTGTATGDMAKLSDLEQVRLASKLPLLIGSGMTADNLDRFFSAADAFIVGSHFKEEGLWSRPVSELRTTRFMDKLRALRDSSD